MSKDEILTELPSLTIEERFEIWYRLGEMDGFDDELSDEELALIERRLEEHERNRGLAISS